MNVRAWAQVRALLLEGGLTVETALPGQESVALEERQNFATTLVQPDGDVLTAIHSDHRHNAELWAVHLASLRGELSGIMRLQSGLNAAFYGGRVAFVPATAYSVFQSITSGVVASLPLLILPCLALVMACSRAIVFWFLRRELRRRGWRRSS